MANKQVFVNHIREENGIKHGVITDLETARKSMEIMFSKEDIVIITKSIVESPTGEVYFFERFCQLVIYFTFRKGLGITIEVSDFHNNREAAFDYYMQLSDAGWKEEDKLKVIAIFNDIEDNPAEIADMIMND